MPSHQVPRRRRAIHLPFSPELLIGANGPIWAVYAAFVLVFRKFRSEKENGLKRLDHSLTNYLAVGHSHDIEEEARHEYARAVNNTQQLSRRTGTLFLVETGLLALGTVVLLAASLTLSFFEGAAIAIAIVLLMLFGLAVLLHDRHIVDQLGR